MAVKIYNLLIILCYCLEMISCNDISYSIVPQKQQYCSFFNNRAPSAQPGLKNCTWFKENSCCLQQEIEATFVKVKPLKGASLSCQKYVNYLMCYICAPSQNLFYQNERLTVCEDFCNRFYEACKTAILKGSPIKNLYSKGRDFCLSRRFLVNSDNCFNFDISLDISSSTKNGVNKYLLFILFIMTLMLPDVLIFRKYNGLNKNVTFKADPQILTLKTNQIPKNCYQTIPFKYYSSLSIAQLLCVYPLFLILLVIMNDKVHADSSLMKLSTSQVKAWAQLLSNDLTHLAKEGLQYEKLDTIMQSAEYNVENINSTQKILEIRNKIVTFFSDKQTIALSIARKVQDLHDDWLSVYSNATTLTELPISVYKDADVLTRLPIEHLTYDRRYGSEVLLNSSSVKLADSVNRQDPGVVEVVQWTAQLDDLFTQNIKQDEDIRWQYFGSSTGVHRSFPGKEWSRNFIGFNNDFDPRSRPWYLSAVSGPKDVVLVIDVSASMGTNNRLHRMKEVVQLVLDTLTKQDRVNIVLSRSSYWKKKGGQHLFEPEIVSCEKTGLIQATASNRRELWAAVQAITAKGGSEHIDAFKLAFELLRNDSDTGGHEPCQRLVLFLTDADIRDGDNRCTKGYYKYFHDGTKEFVSGKLCEYKHENLHNKLRPLQDILPYKASIITFQLDDQSIPKVSSLPGQLACNHNGVMVKVVDDYNIFESMKPYFDFLQRTSGAYQSLWTSPYLDKSGLGLMMTVSVPVYSKVNNGLLGVVGVDVPLEKIENILRHSVWGGVYGFMVDRNDLAAIIHPFAKPTAQLLSDPIFPPVADLETHNGKPEDFKSVLSGILTGGTGDVMVTRDAVTPISKGESLWWKHVEYTHYVFTDIPDSDFSIVLKAGRSDEFGFHHKMDSPVSGGKVSYLSDMGRYKELGMTTEYQQLNPTSANPKYTGISTSTNHSVVKLAPRAFCRPDAYLRGVPGFTDIHAYINTFGSGETGTCGKNAIYKPDVRPDVQLTAQVEENWIDRSPDLQSQLLWTYIGTASGVMRMYPGVRIRQDYDPTSRLWYTRSSVYHEGLAVSQIYTDALPSLGQVVTLSKPVYQPTVTAADDLCQESPKQDGCSCLSDHNCRSTRCASAICSSTAVQAVVAMDIQYKDFHKRVQDIGNRLTERTDKFCGAVYQCPDGDYTCRTRCYLVTDTAHFSYADDFPNITQAYDHISLASVQGYIFKQLVEDKVFVRNYRLDYQGVCQFSMDAQTKIKFAGDPQSSVHHSPTKADSGPIPPFQNQYSCVHEAVYYNANTTVLNDPSYISTGQLTDDPCAEGSYYFVSVPGMNLFLLVIADYRERSEEVNINCHLSNSVLSPGSFKLNYEVCPNRKQVMNIPGSRSCHHKGHASLPCGWSRATKKEKQYQMLLLSAILLFLFL